MMSLCPTCILMKEKTTNLASQVSSLKEELLSLRKSIARTYLNKNNVIMFTTLDMDRNKQALKLALETNKYVLFEIACRYTIIIIINVHYFYVA